MSRSRGKKILGAGQKRTGSATLPVVHIRIIMLAAVYFNNDPSLVDGIVSTDIYIVNKSKIDVLWS